MDYNTEESIEETLELFKGFTITGFRYTSKGYPEIRITYGSKDKFILIAQDAEDNGPGEFFIEEVESL